MNNETTNVNNEETTKKEIGHKLDTCYYRYYTYHYGDFFLC
jgi:hypothetical protein